MITFERPEGSIEGIEGIVLMLEKAFNIFKAKDIGVKIENIEKKDHKIKKEDKGPKRENAFSYVLSKFSNQYNTNIAGINPYVPSATYKYTSDEQESFTPHLQTYYVQERKKKGSGDARNNFHVIHYSDVKEIQRAAKMNIASQNNYVDPGLRLEYDYWKLFSFNFIISGLVYNHVGS